MEWDKQELFTSWSARIFDPANMRAAWEEVAENKGAPGVDAVSIRRWARNWEERLVALTRAARANTYRARKPRRFTVPKKDGSRRTLSILTVTDRVLQRAVLRVVDDTFDRAFWIAVSAIAPGAACATRCPSSFRTARRAAYGWWTRISTTVSRAWITPSFLACSRELWRMLSSCGC